MGIKLAYRFVGHRRKVGKLLCPKCHFANLANRSTIKQNFITVGSLPRIVPESIKKNLEMN